MRTVLYTNRVEYIESYGERRDAIDQRIPEFIRKCGYLPVGVPNLPEMVEDMIEQCHPVGIVLTGGNSLEKYGGDAPDRDQTERKLIDRAIEKDIPIYGFCRGMQMILDYFGNELVNVQNHVAVKHEITGMPDMTCVNSYHNQGCVELKEDSMLEVLAKSTDGVIESVCHKKFNIMATMWHPEREEPFDVIDINRVRNLFGE